MARVPLEDALTEVERFITSVRKVVKKAIDIFGDEDEDAEAAIKTIERLKARELQALRLFSNIKKDQQMMTVRILDSPEWVSLSATLITAIADCEHCRKKVRKILVTHNASMDTVDV